MKEEQEYKGVKAVALFAVARGLAAILVCYGLYKLAGQNIPQLISDIALNFEISQNNHYVSKLVEKAEMVTPGNIMIVIGLVSLYGFVRFVEAYGLWNRYHWTEWFSFLSGSVYIPFEIYECIVAPSIISFGALTINVMIVGYLYIVIKARKKKKMLAASEYLVEQ